MALTRFDAPGFLDDLDAAALAEWSHWISEQFDGAPRRTRRRRCRTTDRGLQFFNPLRTPPAADAVEQGHRLAGVSAHRAAPVGRATSSAGAPPTAAATSRTNTASGASRAIRTPTRSRGSPLPAKDRSTGSFLPRSTRPRVLELYRQHISPDVQQSRSVPATAATSPQTAGTTRRPTGPCTSIQRNNTLGAEIELAAAATIVRARTARRSPRPRQLIACGDYGERRTPQRSAHRRGRQRAGAREGRHHAGQSGRALHRRPVGRRVGDAGRLRPADYWTITRGTKEKALRAVYEVPAGEGLRGRRYHDRRRSASSSARRSPTSSASS